MADFGEALGKVNAQLTKVRIRVKGDRLYLRAMLPPKPGGGSEWKRHELSTGYATNTEGLRFAKAKALEIEGQLLRERFDWTPWLKGKQKPPENCGEWVGRFENNYWESREKSSKKLSTWENSYKYWFKYLPADEPMTLDLLKKTILQTKPESRSRDGICFAFQAIAKFAGLECNFSSLAEGYKPNAQREIPSDRQIEEWYLAIKNPGWRWIFGIIAAYGLRPSEVFHLDISRSSEEPGFLKVGEGTKTGERVVLPIHGRWWQDWELWNRDFPNFETDGNNRKLGGKISPGFKNQGIPITAYHLRDAYAIRCSVLGIDPAIVSRWMGHGLDVHFKQYHKYISESNYQEVWQKLKGLE